MQNPGPVAEQQQEEQQQGERDAYAECFDGAGGLAAIMQHVEHAGEQARDDEQQNQDNDEIRQHPTRLPTDARTVARGMHLGKWQFRPTLWPTLATLVLLVILAWLGIWQLHRADYKRALLTQYRQVTTLRPVSLNQALVSGGLDALPRYRHVQARGHYDSAHQVLLQEMQHHGQVGYEVLTPFVLEPQQRTILVDRGFLGVSPTVKRLPDVNVASDTRTLYGVLGILPVPGIRLGKETVPAGWPKLMLYPRYRNLAGLYGNTLLRPVLLLDAAQADGFVRDWKPDIGFPPLRHDAYALQWFALALALFIIWIVVNSKRIKNDRDTKPD